MQWLSQSGHCIHLELLRFFVDIIMRSNEIHTTKILQTSKLPDVNYEINPYIGCAFGCRYCYASRSGAIIGETNEEWGNYVYIKNNAPDLLYQELHQIPFKDLTGTKIIISSETDPYQGIESKYKITERIIKVLVDYCYPGTVSILTKSSLILRDIELISSLSRVEVGISISTISDSLARLTEPHASSPSSRLRTLQKLHDRGIGTFAFVGPLLPYYHDHPEQLEQLFISLRNVGIRSIFAEHLNASPHIIDRLYNKNGGLILSDINTSQQINSIYREKIEKYVLEFVEKYNFSLRFNKVLYKGKIPI